MANLPRTQVPIASFTVSGASSITECPASDHHLDQVGAIFAHRVCERAADRVAHLVPGGVHEQHWQARRPNPQSTIFFG